MTENSHHQTAAVLDARLGERDRQIVKSVGDLSLLSGGQIRRLYFSGGESEAVDQQRSRRALLRLTRLGVLARLDRRIGGKKSGSAGFCYRLDAEGQRLICWWRDGTDSVGRLRPEPGERFVQHRLAVSEVYVALAEATRDPERDALEILAFEAEPFSWRQYDVAFGSRHKVLKPDAFFKLGVGDFEHWWFCEVDLGTVSRKARESQAAAYRSYYRSGAAGEVMPRVLWLTPNELVGERVRAAVKPSNEPNGLFVVASLANTAEVALRPADGTKQ